MVCFLATDFVEWHVLIPLTGRHLMLLIAGLSTPVAAQVIGDVESFSLVVGPSGEVTHCASGGLRNVKNYPHFNQACK